MISSKVSRDPCSYPMHSPNPKAAKWTALEECSSVELDRLRPAYSFYFMFVPKQQHRSYIFHSPPRGDLHLLNSRAETRQALGVPGWQSRERVRRLSPAHSSTPDAWIINCDVTKGLMLFTRKAQLKGTCLPMRLARLYMQVHLNLNRWAVIAIDIQ